MNQTYNNVPDIISGKDLDYLSDMFNWNYGAYKTNINALEKINDIELKNIIQKATNTFHQTMLDILNILNNGGSNE